MSLINDALRRANQTKKQQPVTNAGAPMRPVEPSKGRTSFLPFFLIVFLIIVLGVAGWFFWPGSRAEPKSIATTKIKISPPKIIAPVTKEKISTDENASKPVVAPSAEVKTVASSEPEIISTPEPTPSPIPIAPQPEAPAATVTAVPAPSLKLQGIFYRASDSTALINGKTVGIGGTVSDARVLAITTEEVTLEWNGQKIVLKFGNR